MTGPGPLFLVPCLRFACCMLHAFAWGFFFSHDTTILGRYLSIFHTFPLST